MGKLNPYMFREYDIRGRETEDELNETSVSAIARAYGTFLVRRGIKKAVVGHDYRRTADEFYKVVVDGLVRTGIEVIGLGLSMTPQMYWAQYHLKSEGGVMITASHNPAGWNGLKLALGYSYTIIGDELQEIRQLADSEDFETGEGSLKEENIKAEYQMDLLSRVKLSRKMKVLVNTGNATCSFFSPDIFRAMGCEVVEHNTNPDYNFPNYIPNPANVDMMNDTGKKTVEVGADIGLALDADGDRLGIVDEKGEVIWPDRWFSLLARQVLEVEPGASIVFDVKVSEALIEDIAAHGGKPVMWKTGHAYIKQKMKEVNSPVAGEQSGHIYYSHGYYGFDDANYAALRMLDYLSKGDKPLSSIISSVHKYYTTPAYHAHADDALKYGVVEKLTEEFKAEGNRVIDINGARVYMDDGWGLIRASSNLPALVLRFEAKTEEGVKKIESEFRKKLEKFTEVSNKWESA